MCFTSVLLETELLTMTVTTDSVFGGDPSWGMNEYLRVIYKRAP